MANLGTLWYNVNIRDDATQKLKSIRNNMAQQLNDIVVGVNKASLVSSIKKALEGETFEINLKTNTQQLRQNIQQQINGMTGAGNGKVNLTGIDAMRQRLADLRYEINRTKEVMRNATYGTDQWRAAKGNLAAFTSEYNKLSHLYKTTSIAQQAEARAARESARAHREGARHTEANAAAHVRLNSRLQSSIGLSGNLTEGLAGMYAVFKAKEFLQTVIEIGGQLEQQRVSIAAILRDSAHADELFGRIKGLALQSPFGVIELDKYTKQLSAYGFQYNELFDMTKRLADISAGAGTNVGRLALALGHVRSATYLTGITLRQFSMNNIPMLKMLSDYYTEIEKTVVTTAEVQKRISNREVGYEAVIEVIKRMTNEGGQFFNMQAVMADTLAGKWKNLNDAIDLMFGEIGESGIGSGLKEVATILTDITKHWREIIPIIESGVLALAAWKLNMIAVNAQATTLAAKWNLLAGGITKAGVALKGFVTNPFFLAFAGMSVAIEAVHHYRAQIDEAKAASDAAFKKGEEGVKNLNDALKRLQPPSATLNNSQMEQSIKEMEKYLKDYSIRAAEIINEGNRVDENGAHVYSLAEKYKYLYENMQMTLEVYKEMKRTSEVEGVAMMNTGGFLDDNVTKDIMDYANARKKWNTDVNKFYAKHTKDIQEFLDTAREEDSRFASATKNMENYADMLKLLIQRSDDFKVAYDGFQQRVQGMRNDFTLGSLQFQWNEGVNKQFAEAEKEVRNFLEGMKSELKGANYDFENLDPIQIDNIRNKIRNFLNSEELAGLDDFNKKYFEKEMLGFFNLKIVTNTFESAQELESWQVDMQKYFDAHHISIKISPEDTPETIAKKAKELHERLQTEMDNSGKVLIGLGFHLDSLPEMNPGISTPWGGMNFDRYKSTKAELDGLNQAIKEYNLNIEDKNKKEKKKGTGAKKDAELEKWQLRVQALKDFYAEWNSLRKEIGRTGAYQKIFDSGIMPDMFNKDGTPKYDLDKYSQELDKLNSQLSGNTDARKRAKQGLSKESFKEINARAKEQAEATMAALQREMEAASRKWDLFKRISESTGDKEGAMKMVFGNTENIRKGIETYKDYMAKELSKVAGDIDIDSLVGMSDTQLADKYGEMWEVVKDKRDEYIKALHDSADEEQDIYLELLESAMTYAQKRAKIEAQRAKDLKAANGNSGAAWAANKKADEAQANLRLEQLKDEINWDVVFGNLDVYTKEVLVKVRKQLNSYIKLNRNRMDVKELEAVTGAMAKLNTAIADRSGIFGGLREALDSLTDAEKDLMDAQVNYTHTMEMYGKDSIQAQEALARLNAARGGVVQAQGGVKQAEATTIDKITSLTNALSSLGKTEEMSLSDVGNVAGNVVDALSKSNSKVGSLIAAILSLLEVIGDQGLDRFLGNLLSNVGRAVGGILKGIGNIFSGLFGDSHGFDFLDDVFGTGYKEYEKAKAEYENLIAVWDTLIDKKNRYLENSWGLEARQAAQETRELLEARREITKAIANERLGAGASTGSHSINYRMWQGSYDYQGVNWMDVADEAVKGMEKAGLGKAVFNGMSDMINMTSKQLEYLMKNYSGLWSQMDDDFRDYIEKLIAYGDEMEEQLDTVREKLTGWTFEKLSDSWANTMANMSNSADNLFEDFEEGLRNAILNSMVSNLYAEEMKNLIESMKDAAENAMYVDSSGAERQHLYDEAGNIIDKNVMSEYTASEYENLRAIAQNLAEREAASRDLLAEMYGWKEEGETSASQVLSGLTEDDQALLMSYINAIRGDVSILRALAELDSIPGEETLSMNAIAQAQLTQLQAIAANTQRNADSAATIEGFCKRLELGEATLKVR